MWEEQRGWINDFYEFEAPANITSLGIYTMGITVELSVFLSSGKITDIIPDSSITINKLAQSAKDAFVGIDKMGIIDTSPYFSASSENGITKAIKEFYIEGEKKTISSIQIYKANYYQVWNQYRNIIAIGITMFRGTFHLAIAAMNSPI
jgi:hypothetical protein